jgi:hypothetical protein
MITPINETIKTHNDDVRCVSEAAAEAGVSETTPAFPDRDNVICKIKEKYIALMSVLSTVRTFA